MIHNIKILNGSTLKIIALLAMVIDHIAAYLPIIPDRVIFSLGGHTITLIKAMRYFGRISFPIYAFLLVEGFLHTRNVKRYADNLLIFALLSEIPWNLVHVGKLTYSKQNVFFTLLLGLLGMWVIKTFSDEWMKEAILLLSLLALSIVLHADYGCSGFGFILMMYLLRGKKLYQAVVGSCFLPSSYIAGLGFIPIILYNGERGFLKKMQGLKYLFYLAYPMHMLVLYFIRKTIFELP